MMQEEVLHMMYHSYDAYSYSYSYHMYVSNTEGVEFYINWFYGIEESHTSAE